MNNQPKSKGGKRCPKCKKTIDKLFLSGLCNRCEANRWLTESQPKFHEKGKKLLELYRARRRCEVPTLNGHIVAPYFKKLHQTITDQIDIFINLNFPKFRKKIKHDPTNKPEEPMNHLDKPPKALWGTEYYYCDVLCDWSLRCKWWLKFVPKAVVRFMNRNFKP